MKVNINGNQGGYQNMTITVFGLGFVGLTTSLGFAEYGHTVYGVEVDKDRLARIQQGKLPFLEEGLDEALTRHLNKRFFAISPEQLNDAIRDSDCIYYCVGTPYGKDGQADLTYLFGAIDQTLAAKQDDRFRVLVVKSTIPPSTTQQKVIPYLTGRGYQVGKTIGVGNNPEFLREGHCWDDFMHADRIVLGVSDPQSEAMLREVYASVKVPVFCVSLNTGEFIKYLSNTLLATLISYSNDDPRIQNTASWLTRSGASTSQKPSASSTWTSVGAVPLWLPMSIRVADMEGTACPKIPMPSMPSVSLQDLTRRS